MNNKLFWHCHLLSQSGSLLIWQTTYVSEFRLDISKHFYYNIMIIIIIINFLSILLDKNTQTYIFVSCCINAGLYFSPEILIVVNFLVENMIKCLKTTDSHLFICKEL